MVRLLLELGANVKTKDNDDATLMHALFEGDHCKWEWAKPYLELMLERGVPIDAQRKSVREAAPRYACLGTAGAGCKMRAVCAACRTARPCYTSPAPTSVATCTRSSTSSGGSIPSSCMLKMRCVVAHQWLLPARRRFATHQSPRELAHAADHHICLLSPQDGGTIIHAAAAGNSSSAVFNLLHRSWEDVPSHTVGDVDKVGSLAGLCFLDTVCAEVVT